VAAHEAVAAVALEEVAAVAVVALAVTVVVSVAEVRYLPIFAPLSRYSL
jgi:hypothetical protein